MPTDRCQCRIIHEQQVEKAKNTITTAIIGLIIVLAAYATSYFVIAKLGEGALGGQSSEYYP